MDNNPTNSTTPNTHTTPSTRKARKKVIVTYLIGAAAGAALGFVYYRLIGCRTGACPLTSTLYGTLIYGGIIGTLAAGLFAAR